MRSAALVALLPLLATLTTAHPHRPGHDHSLHAAHRIRKSLSFGPTHSHASFEVLDEPVVVISSFDDGPVDIREVAKTFIASKIGSREGEGFFIRDDTYTDPRTHITHIYARQLINGLEVSDGDINLNIDRDGRILSWGNSFHPGAKPDAFALGQGSLGETERVCQTLKETLQAHEEELAVAKGEQGAWGLVKAAAQAVLGTSGSVFTSKEIDQDEVKKIHKNMRHIKHHIHAVCETVPVSAAAESILTPVEALVSLLPRISPLPSSAQPSFSTTNLFSTPQHSLAPKAAPAEPPTEIISGSGLADAGVVNDVPARLVYTQTSSGVPRMAWRFEVEMNHNWYESYVDVETGEVLRIVDWASDSSSDHHHNLKGGKQKPLPSPPKKIEPYTYQVFPWGVNDPSTGNLSLEVRPWDTLASPDGWHSIPTASNPWSSSRIPGMHVGKNYTTFNTTIGNNVIAHEDWEGQNNHVLNYRPVNDSLAFVYDYGEPDGLAPKEYVDMVVTQLFYSSNMYHDLLYRYGFDEISGNFQAYNFGKGGRGNDPVICNAQDGSGYNNANFMTPPDGQAPRMRMYVWDTATPFRDGDLEAGIVIHEYSHGLSTRLTGGPADSGCLGWGEAGGMGEGWGDAIATIIRQVEEHTNVVNATDIFAMGAWAANRDAGIRNYKYASNATINPSTYRTLDKPGYYGVHAIGEVWAEFLFVMTERLIAEHGFSKTLFPPANVSAINDFYTKTASESVDDFGRPLPLVPKHGNTLALQLIIDAMKIQPCRPSFFQARDAIIQADGILTGGVNGCLIWKAFAERGLGSDAAVRGATPWGGGIRTDGFKFPQKVCQATK